MFIRRVKSSSMLIACSLTFYASCLLFPARSSGQDFRFDPDHYHCLESKGPIPADLRQSAMETMEQEKERVITGQDKRSLKKIKGNFVLESCFSIDQMMFNGRILFGDPLSEYIQKVAQQVLKHASGPDKDLRFYAFKSETVNAFTAPNGIILVNVGLLANIKNEAELAFIICHEIQHYYKEHAINAYVEETKVRKGKGDYAGLTFQDKVETLYQHSKENEKEADSLGILLYLKTDYDPEALPRVFDLLYYSYMPFEEVPIDRNVFNSAYFFIPGAFFKETLSSIEPIGSINDRYLTHPDVVKRKQQLERLLAANSKKEGKRFAVTSEEEFLQMRQLSRFELVRLNLLDRSYGTAVYHAQVLLKDYPSSEYLQTAVGKGLYGLAKYKNAEEFHRVALGATQIQGESQLLHALFKQLTKTQMNVIALRYTLDLETKYPANPLWPKLQDDLIRDLVVINKVKPEDFYTQLPPADILDTLKRFPPPGSKNNNALLKKQQGFYKLALINEMKDPAFADRFRAFYPEIEKFEKEKKMSTNELYDLEYERLRQQREQGFNLKQTNILIIEPDYFAYRYTGLDPLISYNHRQEFSEMILQESENRNIHFHFITARDFATGQDSLYNRYCRLQEWIQDRENHGKLQLLSLFPENVMDVNTSINPDYILKLTVFETQTGLNGVYHFALYQAQTGKNKYEAFEDADKITLNKAKYYLSLDFSTINH